IGAQGRGTPSRAGIRADIITGTFGQALGGSAGGFIAAPGPVVDLMRQRSRPYLFSNALPPAIVAAAIKAIDIAEAGNDLRQRLNANAQHFRTEMTKTGFSLLPGEHPIIPIMLEKAELAQEMATRLFDEGVYVTGFFYPVVPQGKARIRTQMSAALSPADIDRAVTAFVKVGKQLGIIA
ncbi:MAG: aminotransferase class I/II-fold pyridoxal phosphate-dependent enzyme, partial [Rhodobacteraceae bacterium]|nr:aminotransferase class I/II-fold pyridoxal phosphate-dependent enzyme [Paracoccaceae bacterium]